MFKPRTYHDLCNAMQTGAQVDIDGYTGYINAIGREDYTGRRWVVSIARLHSEPAIKLFFNEPL